VAPRAAQGSLFCRDRLLLALDAGFLVVLSLAQLGQNTGLLAQFFKAPNGALDGLVISNSYSRHSVWITPHSHRNHRLFPTRRFYPIRIPSQAKERQLDAISRPIYDGPHRFTREPPACKNILPLRRAGISHPIAAFYFLPGESRRRRSNGVVHPSERAARRRAPGLLRALGRSPALGRNRQRG